MSDPRIKVFAMTLCSARDLAHRVHKARGNPPGDEVYFALEALHDIFFDLFAGDATCAKHTEEKEEPHG